MRGFDRQDLASQLVFRQAIAFAMLEVKAERGALLLRQRGCFAVSALGDKRIYIRSRARPGVRIDRHL